jgi:hypothetical protein
MSLDQKLRGDDSDIDALLGETIAKVGDSPKAIEASGRLQAMIDAARGQLPDLVDPSSLPVRFTRLKQFALSPAHYLDSCQEDVADTLALRMGAGIHSGLFLNRPVVCYDGRRAGKSWERFERHHLEQDAVILNEKEYRVAIGVIDAVKRHDRAMDVLFGNGAITEQTILWDRAGRSCRSTPDSYGPRCIVDLKSTRCGEPRWFQREQLKRYYHAQLGFYDQALERQRGAASYEQYVVAVENVRPFNVVVWRISDGARLAAEKLITSWWEQLVTCEATNSYPGYVEHDLELDVQPDLELSLGGEPLFVD